ncbi:MAG: hypothetical protein FJ102_05590 [Deltaproteobacteria bacterium]|nr:hypothetical protein [Deltaproteobacteria bacterium]
MAELIAVRCEACGGAVAWTAGKPAPACVFCGATALDTFTPPEGVEPPGGFLDFVVDEKAARQLFRKRASDSIWYPSDLRHARLELKAVLVPAWTWSARLETHYTAVVPGRTRSGKRPVAGTDEWPVEGVLVPSSPTLSRQELKEISPFEASELRPLAEAALPHELGSLTRTAARAQGEDGMGRAHQARLRASLSASQVETATIFHDLVGGPLLLPVWIGAYRRGEALHRVVVNGQTGAITGSFPYSWWKILLAVALVLGLILLCTGGAGLAGILSQSPRRF